MEGLTIVVFEVLFIALAAFVGKQLPDIPTPWFYVLLGLAAFRGGRAVAFNKVFEWLRDLLHCRIVRDTSGAGENVEPTESPGLRQILGELVTCPICAGTWFAMALLVVNRVHPAAGKGLIVVLAAAGVAELLHWGSEFLQWNGRHAREQAGSEWLRKNRLDRRK
jgi:hypothetical protein